MELKFSELPLETQMWIAPELREYFDRITYETASEWLMCYNYGDISLWSSFEYHDSLATQKEFENHKLALFQDGYSLHKIISVEDIEFETKSTDESQRYLNYQINSNITLDSDEVCTKIN